MPCPFCSPAKAPLSQNEFALVLADGFPVSEGHSLVVPRRHVASLFELEDAERAAVWSLVAEIRARLSTELHPDGFNIGVNDGVAAGQTVMHAHVHVIPRYAGDSDDPRGGVRGVIPSKADYWSGDAGD
jgi:diadenosine tetraphosphate (Ap4A) HIT family hydrolase